MSHWIIIQGSEPSHRTNLVQDFLKETMSLGYKINGLQNHQDVIPWTIISGTKRKQKCME